MCYTKYIYSPNTQRYRDAPNAGTPAGEELRMRRRIAALAAVLALALALTATACGGKKSAKVNRPVV